MNTPAVIKLTAAALALAFIPNILGQTPASEPQAGRKGGESNPPGLGLPPDPEDASRAATNISLAYEAFSLPLAKAAELQRKGLTDSALYTELLGAGKLERFFVVRMRAGILSVTTSGTDYRYPSDFSPLADPGDKRTDVTPGARATSPADMRASFPSNPATPTAFERMQLGDSLEIDPQVSADGKVVDLRVSVSYVAFVRREKWGHGPAEVEVPQFESQKLNIEVTASFGSPCLIGTLNLPSGDGLATRAEQIIWFCFNTPTLAPNNAPVPAKAAK